MKVLTVSRTRMFSLDRLVVISGRIGVKTG